MRYLAALALATLVSCGADGEPIKPTANLNIGVGQGGVSAGVRLGARSGPVAVSIGL